MFDAGYDILWVYPKSSNSNTRISTSPPYIPKIPPKPLNFPIKSGA